MAPKTASELSVGDLAPAFEAVDETGKPHPLASYCGKTIVLYFYPKDDTPGCTKEACDFRDKYASFRRKDTVVIGVSPDTPESHQRFKAKFKLPFPLLADPDKKICQAYGVWKEKSMYGRKYMGVERSTFVIVPGGRIKTVWRKVSVPGHFEEVLKSL